MTIIKKINISLTFSPDSRIVEGNKEGCPVDLYTMQYVLAVAEHLNFSLAARDCCVGQSALSQQVSKLERELGTPLFVRTSRGVALTEAGRVFLPRAREILQRCEALRAEMSLFSGLRRGTLNLGVITSLRCIDFGGLIAAFCRRYPEVSINILQDGSYRLAQLLVERKLDLAILNRPLSGLDASLEFLKLGEDCYSLAVPASHPLARCGTVSLRELAGERFIFHQAGQAAAELCLAACRRAGFEPNIVCRSESPSIGLHMVQGGLGVALLPSEEFRDRTLDGVAEVTLAEPIVKEVGAAWRRDAASPLLDAAVRFAKEWGRDARERS